jgi:hypothetical protein
VDTRLRDCEVAFTKRWIRLLTWTSSFRGDSKLGISGRHQFIQPPFPSLKAITGSIAFSTSSAKWHMIL